MSAAGGISGLGITFLPSPPAPPAEQHHQYQEGAYYAPPPQIYQNPYYQHHQLSHSISYDDGVLRDAAMRQQKAEAMIRNPSEDSNFSGGSGHRRVRIASGRPQVYGEKEAMHGAGMQHPSLSPLSDFDSGSSSNSHDFSPPSLGSHPSSSHGSPDYPQHPSVAQYHQPTLRHAQSMGSLPFVQPFPYAPGMQAQQSLPYPPSDTSSSSLHYQHSSSQPIARQPSGTSRLPAFLRERVTGERMARPKSMVELGELFAAQSIEDRSSAPQVVETRGYGGLEDYSSPGSDPEYGDQSPESIPSSAGGLQRRQLEKQVEEQRKRLREQGHRRHVSLDRLPAHPDLSRHISTSRAFSISTSRLPSLDQPRKPRPKSEVVALRSIASMKGLEDAAQGGAFVALDSSGTGFEEGEDIDPQTTSDGMALGEEIVVAEEEEPDRCESVISQPLEGSKSLSRSSTLLTAGANPVRRSKELDRLLAPSSRKLGPNTLSSNFGSPTPSASSSAAPSSAATVSSRQRASSRASSNPAVVTSVPVILEQAKSSSKARVELDLLLESSVVVEGGNLKGKIEVRVRKPKGTESEVWLSKPKVRVVGFEELNAHDARHIFYHHAATVSEISKTRGPPAPLPIFSTVSDLEGFSEGVTGQHNVPFNFPLPIGKGAKGGWKGKQGVVRYIVIASIKLKSKQGADRSIAHFYRHLEIFPYLNPAVALAPALRTLVATTSKGLFMGGNGKVNLTAKMHRGTWVAGQRLYVDVSVENESSKKIKTLTLTLVRTTTIFRPRPWLNTGDGRDPANPVEPDIDADACQTQTTRKKVAESTMEMGKRGTRGVTAKGSWMGVDGGESTDFAHFLLVPSDALTILRGRHVEVTYAVKVSVGGSLSADVSVDIPVRIVNFISLDPPPGHTGAPLPAHLRSRSLVKSWSIDQLRPATESTKAAQPASSGMNRMMSMDSLQLSDLNGGRGPSRMGAPSLSRVASLDTLRTADLPRGGSISSAMSRGVTLPSNLESHPTSSGMLRNEALVGRAKERQLSHAMSLECISSAIASATARRNPGHQRSASNLRTEAVAEEARPGAWEDPEPIISEVHEGAMYYGGGGEHFYDEGRYEIYEPSVVETNDSPGIQLDDLDDDVDEEAYHRQQARRGAPDIDLADESEDEVDAVLGQSNWNENEDTRFDNLARNTTSIVAPQPEASPRKVRSMSPIKGSANMPSPTKSAMKKSTEPFAFATPSSPVKALSPIIAPRSPVRRQVSQSALSPVPSTRRPLPERPSNANLRAAAAAPSSLATKSPSPTLAQGGRSPASQTLSKQPSSSSLKRAPALSKRSSTRNLQAVAAATDATQDPTQPSKDATLPVGKSSPNIAVSRVRTAPTTSSPAPPSPRKMKSPTLNSARSMGDLRTQPGSPRRGVILPSVKSKVAALESRQNALSKLGAAKSSSLSVAGGGTAMSRQNSTSSDSEASFGLDRADSMVSFKAPMLRKEHKAI